MTRRIVAKRKNFHWQPSVHRMDGKTKINKKSEQLLGSINLSFVVIFFLVLAGIIYMYSINASAVKGYKIRQAEKEISELKKSNEQLKIKEAELKSLYHIEEVSKDLDMVEVNNISYIDEYGPVALR